jgi:hypothetical protein
VDHYSGDDAVHCHDVSGRYARFDGRTRGRSRRERSIEQMPWQRISQPKPRLMKPDADMVYAAACPGSTAEPNGSAPGANHCMITAIAASVAAPAWSGSASVPLSITANLIARRQH